VRRSDLLARSARLTRPFADYELVRVHHPDASAARGVPAAVAQERFHAITAAYGTLRGSAGGAGGMTPERARTEARDLAAAIWRARQARRADPALSSMDDRWKDRLMLGFIVLVRAAKYGPFPCSSARAPQTVGALVVNTALVRHRALAENLDRRSRSRRERVADLEARQQAREEEQRLAAEVVDGVLEPYERQLDDTPRSTRMV
jgi:hypothetical protein